MVLKEGGKALDLTITACKEEGSTSLLLIDSHDVEEMKGGAAQTASIPKGRSDVQPSSTGLEKEASGSQLKEPPDGGWGWCVVISGFITLFVLTGISLSLATLLGAYLAELEAPAALGTWIFNVQSAVWCFASLWAEPLSLKFSHRFVAPVAASLCASAIMISAAVKNPYLFFLTISIMYGSGGGICVSCCFQMNRRYFSKRIGMANGLVLCGGTLGVAMMSTLAGTLQYRLDFTYSTLIMGILPLIPAGTSLITFRTMKPYWEATQDDRRKSFFRATAFGGSHFVGATYNFPVRPTPSILSEGTSFTVLDHFVSNFRISALKEPSVISIAAMTGITQFAMINIYTVTSYALKQANVSAKNLMVFLWVAGSTDLVSRLCLLFHRRPSRGQHSTSLPVWAVTLPRHGFVDDLPEGVVVCRHDLCRRLWHRFRHHVRPRPVAHDFHLRKQKVPVRVWSQHGVSLLLLPGDRTHWRYDSRNV
ncbi:uncharacterized protein LOC119573106 [Penaeus monodon]|uniref:uncharacterized protein LOC119573106 n=1 Tax=Penaeus monodon TaxID=6687 RepID=UPI0018A7D4CC|nr:uncharacterized protein LOC119573106 [Penaeus monodon]